MTQDASGRRGDADLAPGGGHTGWGRAEGTPSVSVPVSCSGVGAGQPGVSEEAQGHADPGTAPQLGSPDKVLIRPASSVGKTPQERDRVVCRHTCATRAWRTPPRGLRVLGGPAVAGGKGQRTRTPHTQAPAIHWGRDPTATVRVAAPGWPRSTWSGSWAAGPGRPSRGRGRSLSRAGGTFGPGGPGRSPWRNHPGLWKHRSPGPSGSSWGPEPQTRPGRRRPRGGAAPGGGEAAWGRAVAAGTACCKQGSGPGAPGVHRERPGRS